MVPYRNFAACEMLFGDKSRFALDLATCKSKSENLEKCIARELQSFGGIIFYGRMANLLPKNHEYIENRIGKYLKK